MAATKTTVHDTDRAPVFEPNVQPDYLEIGGDRAWRDWRLRRRRPDLRQRFTPTYPNVNPAIVKHSQALIDEAAQFLAAHRKPFAHRSLLDLNDSHYKVEQLQFRPLQFTQDKVTSIWDSTRPRQPQAQDAIDKLPTFFFEEMCTSLFARVWDFAAEAVGLHVGDDLTPTEVLNIVAEDNWTRSFLRHLPDDFVRIAAITARADPNFKSETDGSGYEYMFIDRESRINLCTSVVGKLLQEQCFDSLLFGARKIEREALRKVDESQEDTADGFARKMSRTASVPKYLVNDLFTENFWPEVDRITLGILKVLLPLINFAGSLEPDAPWPALPELHQSLHNIVAEAGWLANGLAVTRSCFWIDFPQPGQLWDLRQEHVIDTIWNRSRATATAFDADDLKRKQTVWQDQRNEAWRAEPESRDRPKPLRADWDAAWAVANPGPRQTTRRTAKVQVALWPFFERSYPYKQELVSGAFNSGESTTVVQKAQVVYYAGIDDDKAEQQDDFTLAQYLSEHRRKPTHFWITASSCGCVLLMLLLYLVGPNSNILQHTYIHEKAGHLDSNGTSYWSGWALPDVTWPDSWSGTTGISDWGGYGTRRGGAWPTVSSPGSRSTLGSGTSMTAMTEASWLRFWDLIGNMGSRAMGVTGGAEQGESTNAEADELMGGIAGDSQQEPLNPETDEPMDGIASDSQQEPLNTEADEPVGHIQGVSQQEPTNTEADEPMAGIAGDSQQQPINTEADESMVHIPGGSQQKPTNTEADEAMAGTTGKKHTEHINAVADKPQTPVTATDGAANKPGAGPRGAFDAKYVSAMDEADTVADSETSLGNAATLLEIARDTLAQVKTQKVKDQHKDNAKAYEDLVSSSELQVANAEKRLAKAQKWVNTANEEYASGAAKRSVEANAAQATQKPSDNEAMGPPDQVAENAPSATSQGIVRKILSGIVFGTKAPGKTPVVDTPVVGAPVVGTPVVATPVVGTPVVGTPVVGTPVVGTPVVGTPVVGTPVVGTPVVGTPVVDKPVVDKPVVGTPVVGTPVVDKLAVDKPVVGTPVVGTPVVDKPAVGTPVVGTPVVGTPVVGTPVMGTPVVGTPVMGTPVVGTPVVGTPVVGTPVVDTAADEALANQPGIIVTNAQGNFEWILKSEFEADNGRNYKTIVDDKFAAFLKKLKEDHVTRTTPLENPLAPLTDPSQLQQPLGDQPFRVSVAPDTVFTDPARPGETLDMAKGFWLQENILGHDYACFVKTMAGACVTTSVTTVRATEAATAWETETKYAYKHGTAATMRD